MKKKFIISNKLINFIKKLQFIIIYTLYYKNYLLS